ncbi:MAG: AI-2E family transporter [Propionibacteriaceae bacterium]
MGITDRFRSGVQSRAQAVREHRENRRAEATKWPTPPPAAPEVEVPVAVAPPQSGVSEFDQAVPRGLQIAAAWSWRLLLVVAMIIGVAYMSRYFSQVMVPLAIATLLAALLSPIANALKRWGVPRGLAATIAVFGGLSVVAGVLTAIIATIVGQGDTLVRQTVNGFYKLLDWLANSPLGVDSQQLDGWVTQLTDWLVDSQAAIAGYAADIGTQVGHFLAGTAIMLFALFYFLYDGRGIFSFMLNFFPRAARHRVDQAARLGWSSLVAYVRATIIVALVDGLGVLIVALALQVPLAPALAALVFLGAFIPIVGAFVSGFVAVIVALVTLGWVQALIMLIGIIVVMQLEGHVLQPFLLGRAVALHPLAVLLGIAIGIGVAGIVGALIVIPVLAFSKTFIQHLSTSERRVDLRRNIIA